MSDFASNPNVAWLFNNLIKEFNLTNNLPDIALSALEFALGAPLALRPLDVCWGASPLVIAPSTSLAHREAILSASLVRFNGALTSMDASGLTLTDLLQVDALAPASAAAISLGNCYAWGSLFLIVDTTANPATYAFDRNLVGLTASKTGRPVLMSRDIDALTALEWIQNGSISPAIAPVTNSSTQTALEVARFVLDITYYIPKLANGNAYAFDSAGDSRNRVQVHFANTRHVRGAFGFAEEVMASILIPALANHKANVQKENSKASSAIRSLVLRWVNLPSWSPSFVGYWNTAGRSLPSALHAYLTSIGVQV